MERASDPVMLDNIICVHIQSSISRREQENGACNCSRKHNSRDVLTCEGFTFGHSSGQP